MSVHVFAYDRERNWHGYDTRIGRPCCKCGKPGGGTKAYETVDEGKPLCVGCVQADASYKLSDRSAMDEIIDERIKRERAAESTERVGHSKDSCGTSPR